MTYLKQILAVNLGWPKAIWSGIPIEKRQLIHKVRAQKLTYLSNKKLVSLVKTCQEIEQQQLPGIYIEAGCALGGSSILIGKAKEGKRPFYIYDVFGMIPPPTPDDTPDVLARYEIIRSGQAAGIKGDKYYGYEANLYNLVHQNLRRFNLDYQKEQIFLIKGLLQDTMHPNEAVAFAHIDVDWYEPVKVSLERIFPHLVTGGSMILDDYHDWGGCRKATDEYLALVQGQFALDDSAGSLKITRTTAS